MAGKRPALMAAPGSATAGTDRASASLVVEQPMTAPAPKRGDKLTRAGASSGRPGQIVTAANRWRENYNPLRNLTIRRVVDLFELAQRGDTAYLQWAFRFIERRYPTLSAVISRCEAPLLNFDWEIKIKDELPDGCTEDQAKAQQATLKEAYDRVDNLKQAIRHLHMAEFRGYAHLQKHRDESGEIYHLEPLNQWCVCRDGLEGNWFWNPDSRPTSAPLQFLGKGFCIGGDELPLEDFIIRTVERPIDEIGIINAVRAGVCEKDWDGFIEIYGLPGGVVIMPPNVPNGKEAEYEAAAQKVSEGGSGAVPNGADYKANDGPRGVDPFTPRLKHLDEQVVLAGTGGKLTMLAESGSGTLAGGAHEDTFTEIAVSRAERISERFQRDFDAEVLGREHPGQPALVYFALGKSNEDSEATVKFKREILGNLSQHEIISRVLANQTDLKETVRDTGLPVNEEYTDPYVPVVDAKGQGVSGEMVLDSEGDVIGAKVDAPPATTPSPQPSPPGEGGGSTPGEKRNLATEPGAGLAATDGTEKNPIKNRAAGEPLALEDSGTEAYARAIAHDMQVIREECEALLKIEDDRVLAQRAVALSDKIESLKKDILQLPKSAQALAETMIAALMNGLTQKEKK